MNLVQDTQKKSIGLCTLLTQLYFYGVNNLDFSVSYILYHIYYVCTCCPEYCVFHPAVNEVGSCEKSVGYGWWSLFTCFVPNDVN